MKLEQYLNVAVKKRLKAGAISESTANIYKQDAARLPKKLLATPINVVTRDDVQEAVVEMRERGLSVSTVKHTFGVLSSIFNDAVDDGIIQGSPAVRIKLPKQTKPKLNRNVSDEDLKRLVAVAKNHKFGWLFRFALGTGLRRGELCALNWGDINFATCVVTVSRQMVRIGREERIEAPKTPTSYREVTLPLSILQEAVKVRAGAPSDEPVFKNAEGARLGLASASIGIKDLLVKARLAKQTLHSLRHTHASQLISSGLPLPAIAERMGHSNVATTMSIYAHASKGEDAKAAQAMELRF